MTPCLGCKFYLAKGILGAVQSQDGKSMERGGKYSKCTRSGAKPLAMDERATGECGPEGRLRE